MHIIILCAESEMLYGLITCSLLAQNENISEDYYNTIYTQRLMR